MPRGGKRPGAGRKPKALVDKLADGNVGHRPIKVLGFGDKNGARPECPDYLKDKVNKSGGYPNAEEIWNQVVDWLETTGCVHLIPPDYIAEYTLLKVRWLEAEARTDVTGFLARHPVTQQPITSPFIKAGIEYLKAADVAWQRIWKIVAQNSETEFRIDTPNDVLMSSILQYGAQKNAPTKKKEAKADGTDGNPDNTGGEA